MMRFLPEGEISFFTDCLVIALTVETDLERTLKDKNGIESSITSESPLNVWIGSTSTTNSVQ